MKKKLIVIHKVRGLGQFLLPTKTKKNLVFVDGKSSLQSNILCIIM